MGVQKIRALVLRSPDLSVNPALRNQSPDVCP